MTLFIIFCLYIFPIIGTLYIIRYSNIKRIQNNKAPDEWDMSSAFKVLGHLLIPMFNIIVLILCIYWYFEENPVGGKYFSKFKNWLEGK